PASSIVWAFIRPTTPKVKRRVEKLISMPHVAYAIPRIRRVSTAPWIGLPAWDGIAVLSTRTVYSLAMHGWGSRLVFPDGPQRWDTVADLYNKIRTTQPAYDVAGLNTQEYLDIVAYLLKQNGLSAVKEELKNDLNQMRN